MKLFTFVPTIALPAGAPRSAWVCGARTLRPCAPPRAAPVTWVSMCINAETPIASEDSTVVIPDAVPEPVAEVTEVPDIPAVEEVVAATPETEIVAEETAVVAEETAIVEDPAAVGDEVAEVAVAEEAAAPAVDEVAEVVAADAEPAVLDAPVAVEDEKKPTESESERRDKRKRRRGRREVTLPLDQMTIGMELEGTVKTVTNYGAFVGDMGTPTDGLLHVSQLAIGFVENVTDVVQVGMKVKVRVVDIDLEKGNFSLSMKPAQVAGEASGSGGGGGGGGTGGGAGGGRARGVKFEARRGTGSKWNDFKFDPKVFIDARVTTIADFGGFCQLLDGEGKPLESAPTDGLVHISQLSEQRVSAVSDLLKVGQMVKVRVASVDKKRNRISLSMKEYSPDEANTLAEDMAAHTSKQVAFKTSFELAFEQAGIKQ